MMTRPPCSAGAAWRFILPWLVTLALFGCESEPPTELHVLRLDTIPLEIPGSDLLDADDDMFTDVLRRFRDVRTHGQVRGVLLKVGSLGSAWARVSELMRSLERVKRSGRRVVCHLRSTDNLGYVFAAYSCDLITMERAGDINLVGPAMQLVHVHDALSKLGLRAEFLQVGDYKGAADPLTRSEPSQFVKDNRSQLLDGFAHWMAEHIAEGRGVSPVEAMDWWNRGPMGAERAKELGMVDRLTDERSAERRASAMVGAQQVRYVRVRGDEGGLSSIFRASATPPTPHVALVYAQGAIVGRGEPASQISAHHLTRHLEELTRNDDVRAVVVRINSPGGSALASDEIWTRLSRLRDTKPVIVSVGDMAASGGYYIASAATEIWVEPVSVVGSIGVVGGKFSAQRLAEYIGVNVTTLARGNQAGWSSVFHDFSEGEEQTLKFMMRRTYGLFLQRILTGRPKLTESIDRLARGRLFLGHRAARNGLADRRGGIMDALHRAKKLGRLAPDSPIHRWPQHHPLAKLFMADDVPESARALFRATQMLSTIQGLTNEIQERVYTIEPSWVH